MAAFSDLVQFLALVRANYRCECNHPECVHTGRCGNSKSLEHFRRISDGPFSLENCIVLCSECHQRAIELGWN
ncbi:MAG: HNH endonuclease [Candidatus Zixiibacteriota bacterium]|nr:MAG: HNH endonuclease [candidate division Zixibacteria bacterium]